MLALTEWSDIAATLSLCGIVAALMTGRTIMQRLSAIEYRLNVLITEAGVDLDELSRRELSRQVKTLADVRERQLAVELHQRESGLPLEEAQVAVEAYMRNERSDRQQLNNRRSA